MNKFNVQTNKQTPVAAAIHQTNVNKDSVIKLTGATSPCVNLKTTL